MQTYKNVSPHDLFVDGVGLVKTGETVDTALKIESVNFELQTAETQVQPQAAAPAPQQPVEVAQPTAVAPAPAAPQPPVAPQINSEQVAQ